MLTPEQIAEQKAEMDRREAEYLKAMGVERKPDGTIVPLPREVPTVDLPVDR